MRGRRKDEAAPGGGLAPDGEEAGEGGARDAVGGADNVCLGMGMEWLCVLWQRALQHTNLQVRCGLKGRRVQLKGRGVQLWLEL